MLRMETSVSVSNEPEYVTVGEAVARLRARGIKVTKQTIRRWIHAEKIRSVRLPGGRFHVRTEDIDALLFTASAA